VVLSDQQRIDKWLNCENNSFDDCVSLLSPFKKNGLFWYKVSEYVGNIRNKKVKTGCQSSDMLDQSFIAFAARLNV